MPATKHIPAYRLKKPRDRAVVTIDGRDIYLGPYGSPESWQRYDRTIAEWLSAGRKLDPPSMSNATAGGGTVAEIIARYWEFAETYYQKHGAPTGELTCIRHAMRALDQLSSGGKLFPVFERRSGRRRHRLFVRAGARKRRSDASRGAIRW